MRQCDIPHILHSVQMLKLRINETGVRLGDHFRGYFYQVRGNEVRRNAKLKAEPVNLSPSISLSLVIIPKTNGPFIKEISIYTHE